MNIKKEKGSILIFVLVGMLFITAFLIIEYTSVINKSKIAKEQQDIISKIYNPNDDDNTSYEEVYTDLRKNNYETVTISSENNEDTSIIELNNTYDEDLINYKIYGSGKLPIDYQAVEYIESTGTQYIDTGVTCNNNQTVEIDANFSGSNFVTESRRDVTFFGISTDDFQLLMYSTWGYDFQFYHGSNNTTFCDDSSWMDTRHTYKGVINDLTYTTFLDGTQVHSLSNGSLYTGSLTHYLFWANHSTTYSKAIGKIYGCKIWDNDILVRNFIPCYRKADNVIGMYDIINKNFYMNNGSGVFLKGENVSSGEIVGNTIGDLVSNSLDSKYGKYAIQLNISNKDGSQSFNKYIYLDDPLAENDYIDFKTKKVYRENGTTESIEIPNIRLYEDYTKIKVITNNKIPKIEVEYKKFNISE